VGERQQLQITLDIAFIRRVGGESKRVKGAGIGVKEEGRGTCGPNRRLSVRYGASRRHTSVQSIENLITSRCHVRGDGSRNDNENVTFSLTVTD